MNNKPAERSQVDGAQDDYSLLTGIDFSTSEDLARPEFKDESDINKMLARFGVPNQQQNPTFGEVDFSFDLQRAYGALEEAQAAYDGLPDDLRRKYANWSDLLRAVATGELKAPEQTPVVETEEKPAES